MEDGTIVILMILEVMNKMASFGLTEANCLGCNVEMEYYGMPKNYAVVGHVIYPYCDKCAGKINEDYKPND